MSDSRAISPGLSENYSDFCDDTIIEELGQQLDKLDVTEVYSWGIFQRADETPINKTEQITTSSSYNGGANTSGLGKRKESESSDEDARAFKIAKQDTHSKVPTSSSPIAPDSDAPSGSFVVLAYCSSSKLRNLIEELPWGIQWEIARFISIAGSDIDRFTESMLASWAKMGTHAAVIPHLLRVLRGYTEGNTEDMFSQCFEAEKAAVAPWRELDREGVILSANYYGSLGCNSEYLVLKDVDPDWYGGKVHFSAVLQRHGTSFRLALEAPQLRSSCRFARRFGSGCFMRVRIPDNIYFEAGITERMLEYFLHRFIIHKSVFQAYHADDKTVYLLRTDEIYDGKNIITSGVSRRRTSFGCSSISFWEFLEWHNKLELNKNQTMMKWAARFRLGMSNSVPGIRLEPTQVKYEPDIVSPVFQGEGKVPSELDMTDGCGHISSNLLQKLQNILGWQEKKTAVQYRFAGAKGILSLHPDGQDDGRTHDSQIWLRPSQVKIRYCNRPLEDGYLPESVDPALLTLEILRSSRMSVPARLSTETIINMAENGVPPSTFIKLVVDSMQNKVTSLMTWNGPGAMHQLWANLYKKAGTASQRLARMAPGTARAKGFVYEDPELVTAEEEDTNSTDDTVVGRSTAWWPDAISGCPSTLEETAMTLLDSGFVPQECAVLRAKLHKIIITAINGYLKRYQFEVPMSCTAFIIPDPYGVLGPGQIHVKSSHRNLLNQRGEMTDIIRGEVLVTRHPCKVPTDVQKVEAVYHEKLRNFVDVIVVSTKGQFYKGKVIPRSLASMTGGGDYDGDTWTVFWQPDMVEEFRNAHPQWADPPASVERDLVKDSTTVAEFLERTAGMNKDSRTREVQRYLLATLHNTTALGKYSKMWENAIYQYGYFDVETRRLAYMFCAVLDGSKTGKSVSPEAFARDRKQFLGGDMVWKVAHKGERSGEKVKVLQRGDGLHKFIMDEIHEAVVAETARHKFEVKQKFDEYENDSQELPLDKDLAAPWLEATERANQLAAKGSNFALRELEEIKCHVDAVYAAWDKENKLENNNLNGSTREVRTKGKLNFTALPIERRQDRLRHWSKLFASKPTGLLTVSEKESTRIRASYAYLHDFEYRRSYRVKWTRFPWNVAMRALCEIKAETVDRSKTVTEAFYIRMMVGKVFLDNPC